MVRFIGSLQIAFPCARNTSNRGTRVHALGAQSSDSLRPNGHSLLLISVQTLEYADLVILESDFVFPLSGHYHIEQAHRGQDLCEFKPVSRDHRLPVLSPQPQVLPRVVIVGELIHMCPSSA